MDCYADGLCCVTHPMEVKVLISAVSLSHFCHLHAYLCLATAPYYWYN